MGSIAILPDVVADQIAAGEVVERPASVVKELVENALDAGATEISVQIEGGGRSRITVADDGSGMDRDDAVLSIDRHATSKVRIAEDLVGVSTFGFRGEALSSIAAVAKFELETARADASGSGEATRIEVQGGHLTRVEDSSRAPGTTVTVRRLFYNAPARRKFLRSQAAETRAVSAALTLLALARLDVAFSLESDGRTLIDAPRVSSTIDRIQALFGREMAETLIPVDHTSGPVSVRGFVERPADATPSGRKAFLFVNGRPFKDPFLVRAAEAGYRATIHPGSRPSVLLSIAVPGEAVDVNVHPAKAEVRFRDKRMVEAAVEEAVRHELGGLAASAVLRPVIAFPGGPDSTAPAWRDTGRAPTLAAGDPPELPLMISPPASDFTERWRQATPSGTRLMQVFATYILMETPDGLAIIDQHSAHERVLYEEAMAELGSGKAAAQRLLLPLTLDLTTDEHDAVDAHSELLERIGYEVAPFGGRSIVVHAVPNPHPRFDARHCLGEVIADLARGRFGGWTNGMERFAATYACRAAVKAGQILEEREMRSLVARLFACELPPHDVHGRPTIVQLPQHELERRFGR